MKRTTRRKFKNIMLRAPEPIRDRSSNFIMRGYIISTTFRRGSRSIREDSGLPVPSPLLRATVIGSPDPVQFLRTGKVENQMIRDTLERAGHPIQAMSHILDWGCGCGRLARWWKDLDGVRIDGCDYNPKLSIWVDQNLPFVTGSSNGLAPPLPYANASFDFAYGLSVFTHMGNELVGEWMREIRRVMRADGLFFFTIHGTAYMNRLTPQDIPKFEAGEPVVHFEGIEGTNFCSSYHPRAWVEARVREAGFEPVEVIESGTLPANTRPVNQDRYLVRAV